MKYKYDVFISYSRRDYVDESYNVIPGNAIAEIQNVFDENGITYWFDKDGIYSGQEFIEIITGAIAESKMLIFISSKHSNESMWTAGEIFEALDGEKAIIPVKIDNSQYNKKFKLLIRPLDYIDYQENPQNALKDLLRAINKVKEDIAQKQREEEKLRQEKEAEAKKEKIKEEISVLAKDCQRLTLQQIDVVKQIFEKQTYIGNTTKICPICDKEVSISSDFCNRCGWTFPILYYIDGNNTYQLDEKQLSVARTNWRSINMVSELQTIKSNLEIENQRLQRSLLQATEDCKSMTENLKKNESAIQKAKIEIKQMQILNKESDSRIKELEFSIIENKKENEKIKVLYIVENKTTMSEVPEGCMNALTSLYSNLRISKLGLTEQQLQSITPNFEFDIEQTEEKSASGNILVMMLMSIVLFYAIYFCAYQVSSSITTEKTSKIIETLVTSTSPKTIVLGKTIGIGLVGLAQMILIVATALISAKTFLEPGVLDSVLDMSNVTPYLGIMTAIYFILGYLAYALLYALTGSTVSKPEDIQSANSPVAILAVIGFYLSYFTMMNPTSKLNLFASLFPISSPFCMPFRIMMGLASPTDVIISIAILVVTIIIIANVAIKIYSNAILNYGTKMSIKDIIKIYKEKQS